MNVGPACADSYCCWKFVIYSSFTKRTVLPQTTQDNDNYEQTPAVVFLHTAHAKRISLLCYRCYLVYNNETFVFNLKSMVRWLMSHFWVIGWACCIELRKINNKHSHVYHQNHDIFHYNQTLNDGLSNHGLSNQCFIKLVYSQTLDWLLSSSVADFQRWYQSFTSSVILQCFPNMKVKHWQTGMLPSIK